MVGRASAPSKYVAVVKPVADRVVGVVLALLTLPLVLLISLVVLVTLGRPVFFLQERVGQNNRTFKIFKFRTMKLAQPGAPLDNEGRHTRVGRVLRNLSLDELPQFWNVVLGDMSIVGPRPEVRALVDEHYDHWQHRRHTVKPGITGLWQVLDRTADCHTWDDAEVDIAYVNQVSLRSDLAILAATPLAAIGLRRPTLLGVDVDDYRDRRRSIDIAESAGASPDGSGHTDTIEARTA